MGIKMFKDIKILWWPVFVIGNFGMIILKIFWLYNYRNMFRIGLCKKEEIYFEETELSYVVTSKK